MLATALLVLLTAAPTGSFRVEVTHKEDLRGTQKKKGPDYTAPALLKEVFTLEVTEAGPTRPKAVELAMVSGTLGKVTVADERGEAYVRLEKPPADLRLRTGLIRYLDRLVTEDPLRATMASCEGSKDAVEQWLHKNMAWITASQLDELVLRDVGVKCSKTKAGTVHEVVLGVSTPRGRHAIEMTLKGKVVVDPALWVTTWSLAGPMKVVFDQKALAVPMSGTFTSAFNVVKR